MNPPSVGHQRPTDLDAADRLARFRDRFVIDDPEVIYLDGNSLGRLPKDAVEVCREIVEHQWGSRLIRSWNEGWWELPIEIGDMLAPLLGARRGEVAISDSTSVNLYKLASAAMTAQPGRSKIVTDDLNFPTDIYVLGGVADHHGGTVHMVTSDGLTGPLAGLSEAIDEETAVVSLSHTVFKSGYTYDLAEITSLAHEAGALMLWDCSHSVGAVPIDLGTAGADLAVGCSYKYLNGGPGSPAFLYVREGLQSSLENPITAWWAHSSPFEFALGFEATGDIRRFHTGTLPMLSVAVMRPGISMVAEAGVEEIRAKSKALTSLFIDLSDDQLAPLGFELRSPRDPTVRGSHVSLGHKDAWPIARALIEQAKVIPDFRAPDNLRFGFSPLYTSFSEVAEAVSRIADVVDSGAHKEYEGVHLPVT